MTGLVGAEVAVEGETMSEGMVIKSMKEVALQTRNQVPLLIT